MGATHQALLAYHAVAGPVTWNPADKQAGATLSNGNLTWVATTGSNITRATVPYATTGKYYFEVKAEANSSGGNPKFGIRTAAGGAFSTSTGGWGYTQSGILWANAANSSTSSWAVNDVLGLAVDFAAGAIWFAKNNVWASGSPAAGSSPSFTSVTGTLYPVIESSSSGAQMTARFARADLSYPPPLGFEPWEPSDHYLLQLLQGGALLQLDSSHLQIL